MREIEFRSWDYKKMNYNPNVSDGTDGRETAIVDLNSALFGCEDILMQYTGLTDKKGKKIYEGDVVEFEYHLPRSTVRAVIEYIEDEARFSPVSIRNETYFRFEDAHHNTLVVIGNIHENPELI